VTYDGCIKKDERSENFHTINEGVARELIRAFQQERVKSVAGQPRCNYTDTSDFLHLLSRLHLIRITYPTKGCPHRAVIHSPECCYTCHPPESITEDLGGKLARMH